MKKSLTLTIRTPDAEIYSGKVQFVRLLTEQGVIKIFPRHASLTGAIDFTPIVFVDTENNEEDFVARRGIVMVSNKNNTVEVMTFDCERKAELSPTTAKDYLKFVEEELRKGTDLSDFKIRFYEEEKYVIEKQIKYLEKSK